MTFLLAGCGGAHVPDITCPAPFFKGGKIVFHVASPGIIHTYVGPVSQLACILIHLADILDVTSLQTLLASPVGLHCQCSSY
ncbi:hypothetical protein CONLIGDRAFT_626354 [Coniochaeta ligniaria NRRL 30616]|uniref:Uncharacterized protein n=1 Tax=Coniochaeta ligniaria NRRL 30616 TaxID=1408157 RepID=A0A1J7J4M1_9PEZI|nr:hypothetical protein CONLIGDRAFT_626354 [Coniochaeta ligniaria NRRL 30616]